MPNTSTSSPNITYRVHIASCFELVKYLSTKHVKHIFILLTLSISLKLKSHRSGERDPSLKLPALAWARLKQEACGGVAQAGPTHSGETTLAQANGLRLGEPSKQRGGELLLFSLRRELFA